jgi:hypothetical protein
VGALAIAVVVTFVVLSTVRPIEVEEGPPPFPLRRRHWWTTAAVWVAAIALIAAAGPRPPREPVFLWTGDPGDAAVVIAAGGAATIVDPASASRLKEDLLPFVRQERARAVRLVFTRGPKRGAEILEAFMSEYPGAEKVCAAQVPAEWPCSPWPVGAVKNDPGLTWRRETESSLSVSSGGERFLFLSDDRDVPGGRWTAVSFHPKGPTRRLEKRLRVVETGRWILRGRGGGEWERTLPSPVRRSVRDGFTLRRTGRWK